MPTVAPSGAGDNPAVEKRNGGTVIKGGNVPAGSPITKSLRESTIADNQGQSFGSKVIASKSTGDGDIYTDRAGIIDATGGVVTDGVTVLGYQPDATEWVVMGGNITTTLAGVANKSLISAAADVHGADPTRDSTYQLETTRRYGNVAVDIYAAPASGYQSWVTKSGASGVLQNMVRPSGAGDEASADKAANTTRSVPGELTYMFGGKLPKTSNYKAKYAAET